jgi:hypothetical protein
MKIFFVLVTLFCGLLIQAAPTASTKIQVQACANCQKIAPGLGQMVENLRLDFEAKNLILTEVLAASPKGTDPETYPLLSSRVRTARQAYEEARTALEFARETALLSAAQKAAVERLAVAQKAEAAALAAMHKAAAEKAAADKVARVEPVPQPRVLGFLWRKKSS